MDVPHEDLGIIDRAAHGANAPISLAQLNNSLPEVAQLSQGLPSAARVLQGELINRDRRIQELCRAQLKLRTLLFHAESLNRHFRSWAAFVIAARRVLTKRSSRSLQPLSTTLRTRSTNMAMGSPDGSPGKWVDNGTFWLREMAIQPQREDKPSATHPGASEPTNRLHTFATLNTIRTSPSEPRQSGHLGCQRGSFPFGVK
eukprot:20836-Heterocapsa_arctica.AAC.1